MVVSLLPSFPTNPRTNYAWAAGSPTTSQAVRIYEAIPSEHFCFLGSTALLF